MILLDANVLLCAYNAGATQHEAARHWLEDTFNSNEIVRLSWSTIHAFLRIGTNPRVFEQPLAIEHGAVLVTTDRDFLRFEGSKMLNPLRA